MSAVISREWVCRIDEFSNHFKPRRAELCFDSCAYPIHILRINTCPCRKHHDFVAHGVGEGKLAIKTRIERRIGFHAVAAGVEVAAHHDLLGMEGVHYLVACDAGDGFINLDGKVLEIGLLHVVVVEETHARQRGQA